jgi:hypothetical protein
MAVHLTPIDFEALAELNIRAGDDFFKLRLALYQRQLSDIVAVEIKQVESYQDNLEGTALKFILQNREVSSAVCRRHNHLAIDNG